LIQRLNLYLFRQLLIAFLFSTGAICLVVLFTQSFRFLSFVIENSATVGIFFGLMGLLIPTFLPLVMPLALGIGVLFAYHKFAIDSELVVMRAAGMSSSRLAFPAILLSILVFFFSGVLTTYVTPAANRELVALQYKVRNNFSLFLLRPGTFNDLAPGLTFYVNKRGPGGELQDILIHDVRKAKQPVTIMAASGRMTDEGDKPQLVISNGKRQELDSETGHISQLEFEDYVLDVDTLRTKRPERFPNPREQTMEELLNPQQSNKGYSLDSIRAELHQRLASPLLALSYAFIGFTVILAGEFNRRGMTQRILIAGLSIIILQASFLSLSSLIGKNLWVIPILYALGIVPVVLCMAALKAPYWWRKLVRFVMPPPTLSSLAKP